jgi:hypothetical protein
MIFTRNVRRMLQIVLGTCSLRKSPLSVLFACITQSNQEPKWASVITAGKCLVTSVCMCVCVYVFGGWGKRHRRGGGW